VAFSTPPLWPVPPQGWEPGPDWRPDPCWPAAPADWVFWSDAPNTDGGAAQAIPKPVAEAHTSALTVAADPSTEALQALSVDSGSAAKPRVLGHLPLADTVHRTRDRMSTLVAAANRVVNPIRVLYGATAVAGLTLFGWMFTTLRFNPEWNFDGWMWRGVWPVLALVCGLVLGVAGIAGTRRWDHRRWVRHRIARREVATP
jgi:hypothetical protein